MATSTFKNPINGYTEEVDAFAAGLGAALLGPLYFAIRGAWGIAVGYFIGMALLLVSKIGWLAIPFVYLFFTFGASKLLEEYYLKKGWHKIDGKGNETKPLDIIANLQPAPKAAAAPAHNPVEQLEKLHKLKESGALNDEEYSQMKSKLLAEA